MTCVVRPFTNDDISQVVEIYIAAFAEPPWSESWSEDEVRKDMDYALSQTDPVIIVAEIGRDIIGFTWGYNLPLEKFPFLSGNTDKKSSYMDEIAVRPEKRLSGVGKLLGQAYMESARRIAYVDLVLRTDENNSASLALFRNMGLEIINGAENPLRDPVYPSRIYMRRKL